MSALFVAWWTMGAGVPKALRLGAHHGAVIVPAQGALLFDVGSDGRQVVFARGFV